MVLGLILEGTSDFLSNRTQKVLVGGQTSDSTYFYQAYIRTTGHCPGTFITSLVLPLATLHSTTSLSLSLALYYH